MSIAIDIIITAVFLFFTVRFAILGLACSLLSSCKFLFSIICASLLASPVAMLMGVMLEGTAMAEVAVSSLSGVVGFVVSFLVIFLLSGLIIRLLSKIKIPVITKVDKLLGLVLGLIVGLLTVSAIATAVYAVAEVVAVVGLDPAALDVYEDSYVFKFVYDLKIFDFIRNLI